MADCKIISLAAYRSGLRTEGTTLIWRGYRHVLEGQRVVEFCEALLLVNQRGRGGPAAGFSFWADKRCVHLAGWDMGPMTIVRGDEVKRLAIRLMTAEQARRAEGLGAG